MADYTNWQVGDVVNICASIRAFCGSTYTGLIFNGNAISKHPDLCTTVPGTSSCPVTIDNVGITFKLVKGCNSHDSPIATYRNLGQFYTNTNGQAAVQFTVLSSDLDDYNSSGGNYQAMMTITDSKGQDIIELSNCTYSITISDIPPSEKWRCSNAATNICIRDDIIGTYNSEAECKAALSCQPPSGATDYIEYDFNFLPTSFLDLVGNSMVSISDGLGEYLPTPNNINYVSSEYNGGKFRIYVAYTVPTLSGLSEFYTSQDRISDLSSNLSIVSLMEISLDAYARLVSVVLIFAICQMLLVEALGFGTIVSIITSVIGAVAIDLVIHNIPLDISTPDKTDIPPDKQIEAIREFANNTRIRCGLLTPGCNTIPVTCNSVQMAKYNICTGAVNIEERINDDKQSGTYDPTVIDELIAKVINRDIGLQNGTITPQQAKTEIDNDTDEVVANSEDKQLLTTCDTGFTYNTTTKKCIPVEQCAIRNPFGGCILSRDTAQGLLMFGGLIIGGYIIMSSGYGHGSTERIVTIREQSENKYNNK